MLIHQVVSEQFNPLAECPSEQCKDNNIKGKLTLQTRASLFARFQEAKVQELVCACQYFLLHSIDGPSPDGSHSSYYDGVPVQRHDSLDDCW